MNHVSIKLEQGEIVGLLGPNGAGKSTLIDVISGRARKWTGQVHLFDRNISRLRASQRRLIDYIASAYGLAQLSPPLREIAELRMTHPDESLSELGARCNPPIAKPTVSSRLSALGRLAARLRNEQGRKRPAR